MEILHLQTHGYHTIAEGVAHGRATATAKEKIDCGFFLSK